jgi:hypothetical protein
MHMRRAILFFSLLFGLVIVPKAYGRGASEEDRLPEAAQLIEERRYNEAQLILADIIRREPERLDEVEEYLQVIRGANVKYNDTYIELIEILNPPAGQEIDRDAAYAKIREMEELNRSPNEEMEQAFAEMRESIVFAIENQKYESVMAQAGELYDQARYWEATATYLTGYRLHEESFRNRNYGSIAENRVDGLIINAETTAGGLLELEDDFGRQLNRFRSAIEVDDVTALRQALPELKETLIRIHSLADELDSLADELARLRDELLRENESDIPYISTIVKLIRGRQEFQEGIQACMLQIWEEYSEEPYRRLRTVAQEAFTEGTAAALAGQDESAARRFETAEGLGLLLPTAAGILGEEIVLVPGEEVPAGISEIVSETLSILVKADAVDTIVTGYDEAEDLSVRTAQVERDAVAAESLEELGEVRNDAVLLADDVEALSVRWHRYGDEWSEYSEVDVDAADLITLAGDILDTLSDLSERTVATEIRIVHAADLLRFAPLQSRLDELTATVSGAQELITGIPRTIGSGDETQEITARYPADAEEILRQSVTELDELAEEIGQESERIDTEKAYVRTSPVIREDLARTEALAAENRELTETADRQIEVARQQVQAAELFRQEGERRLLEAQDLTRRNEFARARRKLEDAADRFAESLLRREDPEVRVLWDTRITELQEEIGEAEKRIIVQEVRDYIIRGKAFYSQGDFSDAEGVFLTAQKRWSTISVEPMSEVEYWLALTQTALSVNSGRVIEGESPLFAEMTSILNLARRDFERGKRLMEEGNREDALTALDEAEKKLLYVQTLFPFNKEASVLSLRILQVRDPADFQETFGRRFREARDKIRTNPQEAYVELKDLEAISPSFPGLAAAIYNAEIATGIRLPPPDPVALAKSESLYEQAFTIVSSNVRSQFPIAITYLNQALELNPDNLEAARLKDRIYIDAGSTTTTILSSADQQEYRRAEELFISGEYYVALAVVDRLLQNPENQRNLKVIELKRRIESKI